MMRKFTTYLFISCSSWFFLTSCDDDEASAPPKSAFTQDKTSVLTGEEVTFVVDQVDADAIALLPYGQEETGKGGVLISKSAFQNGKATVKFSYTFVGEFNPVVVTSNFSGDGESIERTYSDAKSITVSSDLNSIDDFSFDGSTKTTIDQTNKTIVVQMAYANDKGEPYMLNALKAKFKASPYTTLKVNGVEQKSGETVNNFTSPVIYTVTAYNGESVQYTVTVNQTPIETNTDFKSVSGKALSTSYKDKSLQGYIDNAGDLIVLIAPFGQTNEVFDSVKVGYALAGSFATTQFGAGDKPMKQDTLINITSTRNVTVVAQQKTTTAVYDIKGAIAPKLDLSFQGLNPTVTGTRTDFDIKLNVLKGTDVTNLTTTGAVTLNNNQTLQSITYTEDGGTATAFVSGVSAIDFTKPVKFSVTVNDTNIGETFTVNYTATVVVVP